MYHHYQYPVAKKEPQMFSTFLGLNDLHMKCFQEMYLDTYQALTACGTANFFPHISPTSVSTDSTSSNCMLSPLQLSPASASSYSSSSSSPGCGNMYTGLQQQKLLAVHQQHLTATAMAQHQLAMTAVKATGIPENTCRTATTSLQHHDEISKSLKMFAMLTANSNGHDFLNNKPASDQVIVRGGAQRSDDVRAVLKSVNVSQISEPTVSVPSSHLPQISSVDAVMQDFAGNGYIADELNRSQYGMHIKNTSNLAQNTATRGVNTTSLLTAAANQRQQLQQHNINLNFNNKFLKMFPAHLQQHSHGITTAAAATATAAANIEYNCNRKKLPKRYNGIKNDKYPSSKHCVFCENNHEPEAVVKSHSVRDSYGRVLCPKLRTYICPICGASGDEAHTVKYCPQKPIITMEDAIKAESFRLAKNAYYKPQMKV